MSTIRARKLPLVLALLALGCAVAASWLQVKRSTALQTIAAQSQRDASAHSVSLQEHRKDMERIVSHAAAIPPLREALSSHVDNVTLLDLLDSEDWWEPFAPYGVGIFDKHKALVLKGPGISSPTVPGLAQQARQKQLAFALAGDDDAFEVVAKRIDFEATGESIVLALCRPSDLAAKKRTADAHLTKLQASAPAMPGIVGLWACAAVFGLAALLVQILHGKNGKASPIIPAPSVRSNEPASVGAVSLTPSVPLPHHPTAFSVHSAQTFGRYNLLERIGEGGMAEIYAAVLSGAEGFQRYYVVKRLRPELAQNKAAVEQFIDEAKLGSQLVHSNIVPVFDFGRVGSGYFLAQEYIVGRNLGELMQRHKERLNRAMPPSLVCFIAHEVLEALAYAHDKLDDAGEPLNIVHRDVSSANIMVSLQGEVKLLDFGIVKASTRISQTDFGNIKGNALFMSPEQARGLSVDKRSDLFSLGVVLYHLLTGEQLYSGETTAEVFYKASTGPTADHLARIRCIPEPLPQILERALALNPGDRFSDASTFAEQLAPYTAGARSELATLMNAFFGDELRRKTAEFRPAALSTSQLR